MTMKNNDQELIDNLTILTRSIQEPRTKHKVILTLKLQAELKSNNYGFSTPFRQKLYEWGLN